MDEIEIDEVELEFLETGLEGGFDAFGTMIGIPELRDDKNVLPLDLPLLEYLLHRFADLFFGSVAFRGVEQAKSCLQRRLRRGFGCHRVGNQCPESKRGDRAGSVVERYLRIAKLVGSTMVRLLRYFPVRLQARDCHGSAPDVDASCSRRRQQRAKRQPTLADNNLAICISFRFPFPVGRRRRTESRTAAARPRLLRHITARVPNVMQQPSAYPSIPPLECSAGASKLRFQAVGAAGACISCQEPVAGRQMHFPVRDPD